MLIPTETFKLFGPLKTFMEEIKIRISDELKKQIVSDRIDLRLLIGRLVKQIKEEKEMADWSVRLQKNSRKGRFKELKNKGFL